METIELTAVAESVRSYLIGLDRPYPELTVADLISRHVSVADSWPPRPLTVAEVTQAINELGTAGCLPTVSDIADRESSERSEKARQAVIRAAKEAGIAAFDAAYHAELEAAGIDPAEQEP